MSAQLLSTQLISLGVLVLWSFSEANFYIIFWEERADKPTVHGKDIRKNEKPMGRNAKQKVLLIQYNQHN